MKKILQICSIVTIIALVAGCGGLDDKKPPIAFGGIATYENEEYRFSLDYPTNWVKATFERPPLAGAALRFDPKENSKFPIQVFAWKKKLEKRRQELIAEYNLVSEQRIGFAVLNWRKLVLNSKDNTQTYVALLTEGPKYTYEIFGLGFQNGIAVNDDVYSIIASSFRNL